ncbi:MAG: hypothetical protein ACPG8W_23900 [Candidatus Promineifilaceae bacterium]
MCWRKLLALFGIGMALIGCSSGERTPGVPVAEVSIDTSIVLEVMVDESGEFCQLRTTIYAPIEELDLAVSASAENGLLFTDTNTTQSEPQSVRLFAGDKTVLTYECMLDPQQIQLSGEYQLRILAVHADDEKQALLVAAPVYITIQPDGPKMASDAVQFASALDLAFHAGSFSNSYAVELEPESNRGTLWLRVTSPYDQYQPNLIVDTTSGAYFSESDPTQISYTILPWGKMKQAAVRIIQIPFWLDLNSKEGTYSFRLTYEDRATGNVKAELAPYVLTFGAEGSEPRVGLSIRQVVEAPPFEGCCTKAEIVLVATAETPSVAVESVPTPIPASPASAQTTTLTKIVWQRQLSNLAGHRWNMYEQHIQGKVPLSWEAFKEEVLRYNPQLIADAFIFRPEKTYLMPEFATVAR